MAFLWRGLVGDSTLPFSKFERKEPIEYFRNDYNTTRWSCYDGIAKVGERPGARVRLDLSLLFFSLTSVRIVIYFFTFRMENVEYRYLNIKVHHLTYHKMH